MDSNRLLVSALHELQVIHYQMYGLKVEPANMHCLVVINDIKTHLKSESMHCTCEECVIFDKNIIPKIKEQKGIK